MLTLYYVTATFLQSWRIKNVCNKIAEQLSHQASVSFYALPNGADDGFDSLLATSDLCVNRSVAKVSEILWLCGSQRGCCLSPMQVMHIKPWISFADTTERLLPFAHAPPPERLLERLAADGKNDVLHLLVETQTQPCYEHGRNEDIIRIEDYGKLIAWKIDSHLAVLIETDVEHFTKLLISTYLQNNFLINDQLPLLRIESIKYEGAPQPFELLASHLRKPTRLKKRLSDVEWVKHLEDLRALSVLAHQATEFEYKKNLTEGKAGVIKPDLIPSEQQAKVAGESHPSVDSIDTAAAAVKTTTILAAKTTTASAAKIAAASAAKTTSASAPKTTITATAKTTKATSNASTTSPSGKTLTIDTPTKTSASKKPIISKQDTAILPSAEIVKPEKSEVTVGTTKPVESETTVGTSTATPVVSSAPMTVTSASASNVTAVPTKTSPLGKMKAKPTEIKKAGDGRFKTTKISEPSGKYLPPEPLQPGAVPPITISAAAAVIHTTTTASAKISPSTIETVSSSKNNSEQLNKSDKMVSSATIQPTAQSPLHAATTTEDVNKTINIKSDAANGVATAGATSAAAASNGAAKRPSLQRHKDSLRESKPLNILVYSESVSARESALTTLKDILERDNYTIYTITLQQIIQKYWLENTALLVVCGTVPTNIGEILVDYFLHGGKVLSLCSDILHFVLPNYRTAEVREHELVQFSYDKWTQIKMMHHIFCYQPSPVKKNFSTDSDDATQTNTRKPALVCPRSIELKDLHGDVHNLDVKVLGTEETWNTPSLLLANNVKSGGRAVFSQVHLEANPSQFEMDESKYDILKRNDKVRLEILADLLSKHLELNVQQPQSVGSEKCVYQEAYFLGRHESKFELLAKLNLKESNNKTISTSKLTLKFCGKGDTPGSANNNLLPILIHSCPEDFSTVEYFEDLKTEYIGRLLIYAPIVSSSMNVINELELTNGLAVLVRQQTEGIGRGNNQWLSPIGCAMFSIQLHIPLDTALGGRLPLLQHIIGAAMVNALRGNETYKVLNIGLKWPNDIYANSLQKIGGLIVKTTLIGPTAIVNLGCGMNLDNENPTTCLNALIREYNRTNRANLPRLKYEEFVAITFNEIERLLEAVQAGDFTYFYKLYYNLWLHNEQTVKINDKSGNQQDATVAGIDDYGYLKVRTVKGTVETVQPDGNSFDMLQGLIVPKFN